MSSGCNTPLVTRTKIDLNQTINAFTYSKITSCFRIAFNPTWNLSFKGAQIKKIGSWSRSFTCLRQTFELACKRKIGAIFVTHTHTKLRWLSCWVAHRDEGKTQRKQECEKKDLQSGSRQKNRPGKSKVVTTNTFCYQDKSARGGNTVFSELCQCDTMVPLIVAT